MFKSLVSAGLLSISLGASASATLLYVASYAGTVTTLNLTLPIGNSSSPGNLEIISTSTGCGTNPTWLTLDSPNSILYCLDEGFAGEGSVSSLSTNDDGSLVQLSQLDVITGPVFASIYGENADGLALPQYSGSSFSTISIADPSALAPSQNTTFTLAEPGPVLPNQDASHPHQALPDPTGEYILVPDLGADLVRVFHVAETGIEWTAVDPFVAPPGSGPRHGAFLVTADKTFYYLASELADSIAGYEITYNSNSTLSFTELFSFNTHGPGASVPSGTTAAEVIVSPDKRFLTLSTRADSSFTIPNFDPTNSTELVSDSLVSYSIDNNTGELSLLQIYPSGGRVPRQFSLNKAGDLVAVGSQTDSTVVVIKRDVETGLLQDFVGNITIPGYNSAGTITAVVFDD